MTVPVDGLGSHPLVVGALALARAPGGVFKDAFAAFRRQGVALQLQHPVVETRA